MQRTTITLISLIFFATGIWFGTSTNHSYLVSKAALWIYFFVLVLSSIFTHHSLKITCAWLSVPLALWAGWSDVQIWRAATIDSFSDYDTFTGAVHIIDLPDERSDYSTFLTVVPIQPAAIHHAILIKTNRYPEYSYGDTLWVKGTIKHPAAVEDFDYPLFLQQRGITATMSNPQIHLDKVAPPSIRSFLFSLRADVEKVNDHYLHEPEASFLNGILIGNEHAIPTTIQNDLSSTSTTHLIVVGGAKLSIFLALCLGLLPISKRGGKCIAIIILAVTISLLTDGSAGVVRGALVAVFSTILSWQERIPTTSSLVALPAAAMLVANPLMLKADAGFQISCLAYAGLVFLTPLFLHITKTVPYVKDWPNYILHPAAENSAITLAIGPLSYHLFGQTGAMGIVVNPAVFWLLGTLMVGGICLFAISWWPQASFLLSLPLWVMLHEVLSIIHWGALLGGKL